MKIYTKKGDGGKTSLIGGDRVHKNHIRIEAYGTVDELNSCIGLIRDSANDELLDQKLVRVQNNLFTIGSNLASGANSNMKLPKVEEHEIDFLEEAIDEMEVQLPPLKNFILPGGNLAASFCHQARCVCRRAERRVVELSAEVEVEEIAGKYLNRLSDYFFVLARSLTHKNGGVETPWQTRT